MKIYDGINIEIFTEDKKTMFYCPGCSLMTEDIPIRVVFKDNKKMATYHKECVKDLIILDQSKQNKLKINKSSEIGVVETSSKITKIDNSNDELKNQMKKKPTSTQLFDVEDEFSHIKSVEDNKPESNISLLKDETLIIKHPYDQNLVKKYHTFGKKFEFKRELSNSWICNLKYADALVIHFFKTLETSFPKYDWTITNDARKVLKKKILEIEAKSTKAKEIREIKKVTDIDSSYIDFSGFKIQPFPYQKVGIAFLDKIDGIGLIGDEPGVGKSFSAIGYTSLKSYKTIIVCPASLKYNWQNEIMKFSYKTSTILSEFLSSDLNPKILTTDYYIINYEQLEKYSDFLKKAKFDCVILDESHYIANLQSKRTKIVFKLFNKLKHKILLSGTPIKSRPIEFYAQLKFLKSEIFSNKQLFGLRYCDAKETKFGWDFSGASNLEELNRKISSFYIRRIKKDVLKDLPDKLISYVEHELSTTEKKEYKKLDNEFKQIIVDQSNKFGLDYINKPIDNKQLALMTKLKQFCANAKLEKTIEFVKEFLDSTEDRKIIVFSQYINTQTKLKEAFSSVGVSIMGADDAKDRNDAVNKFQSDPKIRVFIGSTLAAGVGLTLTAADTVIFNDLLWTPAEHTQAEDRAYRIGQKNTVNIYYPIFKDSIEERILKVLDYKSKIVAKTIENTNDETSDSKESIYKLLLKDYLET